MNQNDLIKALARIRAPHEGGRIVGTGILVSPRHVLTCAHVVAEALGPGVDGSSPDAPQAPIVLDLPATAPGRVLMARVIVWHPRQPQPGGMYDIAGLELSEETLPEDAKPVPLVSLADSWNQPCRIFGFPAGRPDGNYAEGTLKDVLVNGWVMIRGGVDAREFTRPGYSGGPVYTSEGVVGMLTEGDRDQRIKETVMIPTAVVLAAWPDLYRLNSTCPYQGLASFTEAQARFFRGRESITRRLSSAVSIPASFTVLAGASGSGKSSVIFAGVIPTVKAVDVPEHDHQRPDAQATILIASFRPGDAPLEALAHALLPLWQPELAGTARLSEVQRLGASLREGTLRLPEVITDLLRKHPPGSRLLLVIDQGEELFTQAGSIKAGTSPAPGTPKPLHLLTQLKNLLEHPMLAARVSILIAIRTDYLDKLLEHPALSNLQHQPGAIHYLGPVDDHVEVIEGPLRELGIGQLEEGLAARILKDLEKEPNPLPLLEFTLTELWHRQHAGRLTHAAYTALGGVDQAVASYAQGVFETLPPQEQRQAQDIFIQLAQPGPEGMVLRRVARLDDFSDDKRLLIKRLADSRLIVTGRHADAPDTVEVVHEALFEHWPLLQGWVRESWVFRTWQEALRRELREWLEYREDPSYLLQGARLATAQAYLRDYQARLSQQEQAFIARSAERQEARQREQAARLAREASLQRGVNRALSAFLGVALLLSGLAFWQWDRASGLNARLEATNTSLGDALGRAEANAREALAARLSIQGLFLTRNPSPGSSDMRIGALLAAQAVQLEDNSQSRGNLLRVLQSDLVVPSYDVTEVALGPDSSTLAVANLLSGDIFFWDLAAEQRREGVFIDAPAEVSTLTFSPDGRMLAASVGSTIYLWSVNSGDLIAEFTGGHDLQVWDLTFSPDGTLLLSCDLDGGLVVWEVPSGRSVGKLNRRTLITEATAPPAAPGIITLHRQTPIDPELDHRDLVRSVTFSPDGTQLAVAAWDGLVHLFTVSTLEPLGVLAGTAYQARSVQFSPDGFVIAVGSRDGAVHLWDAKTFEGFEEPLRELKGQARALAFSPDGEVLTAGDALGRVALWNYAARQRLGNVLEVSAETVNRLSFTSDTLSILGQENNQAVLWQMTLADTPQLDVSLRVATTPEGDAEVWVALSNTRLDVSLEGTFEHIAQLAFSPDGQLLAVRNNRFEVQVWDTGTRELLAEMVEDDPQGIEAMAFSADGNTLLTGNYAGQLVLRDPRTGVPLQEPIEAGSRILGLAYHPGGDRIAVGMEGKVVIWDTDAWVPLGEVSWGSRVPDELIWTIAFSPDGTLLVGGHGSELYLWDSDSLAMAAEPLPGAFGDRKIRHLAFSPDSRMITVRYEGSNVALWNLQTREVTHLRGSWSAAAYSADGKMLALGHTEGRLTFLDAVTLDPLGEPLDAHGEPIEILVASQDGRWLATASAIKGNRLLLWDLSLNSWLDHACARAGRNLTGAEWTRYLEDQPYEKTCPDQPVDASAVMLLLTQAEAMLPNDAARAREAFERASQWALELGTPELVTRICRIATNHGFAGSLSADCQQLQKQDGEVRHASF